MRGPVAASALVLAATLAAGGAVSPSAASPAWAPADQATIHPGVMMYTKGAQCTGNFVFTDRRGRVYVGYAAHCAATGAATDTDGCRTRSLPLGTPVRLTDGGNVLSDGTTVGSGRLAYSSWRTMQRLGTRSATACAFNDFALVRLAHKFVHAVNPSVPFWGGPTGVARSGTTAGERVYSYGNSSLRAGAGLLGPKLGVSLGDGSGRWTRSVYTASPGVPGDSGSGFLDADGKAWVCCRPSPWPRSPGPTGWATWRTSCGSRGGTPGFPDCGWSRAPSRSRPCREGRIAGPA